MARGGTHILIGEFSWAVAVDGVEGVLELPATKPTRESTTVFRETISCHRDDVAQHDWAAGIGFTTGNSHEAVGDANVWTLDGLHTVVLVQIRHLHILKHCITVSLKITLVTITRKCFRGATKHALHCTALRERTDLLNDLGRATERSVHVFEHRDRLPLDEIRQERVASHQIVHFTEKWKYWNFPYCYGIKLPSDYTFRKVLEVSMTIKCLINTYQQVLYWQGGNFEANH